MVYYERPENTLNPIGPVSREQAQKLVESFSAAGVACCMEPETGRAETIEIRPLPVCDYRAVMERTSRSLIDDALRRSGGNHKKAAEDLGLKRTTFMSMTTGTRRTKSRSRPRPEAMAAIG